MKPQPRSMEDLARHFGMPVERVDLPASVGGRFIWEIPCIAINRNRHPLDQEYTIAHELGHAESLKRKWYYRFRVLREFEAATFAYAALFVNRRFDVIDRHLDQNPLCVPLATAMFFMWLLIVRTLKAHKWFSR